MEKQISEEEERLNVMQKLQNFITNTLLTETQRFHEFKVCAFLSLPSPIFQVYSTADMLDSYSSDFMGFANEVSSTHAPNLLILFIHYTAPPNVEGYQWGCQQDAKRSVKEWFVAFSHSFFVLFIVFLVSGGSSSN